MIKIIESTEYDTDYTMSYEDSANPGTTHTTQMDYNLVGAAARRIDFLNTRITAVPTGIENNPWEAVAFSLIAISLIALAMLGLEALRKRVGGWEFRVRRWELVS